MNNERKPNRKSLRQVLLSAISLTLIFSIFNLGGGLRVFAETSLKKNFTGEQVFRGVLFGEGEVAELFPEIWKDKKNSPQSDTEWIDLEEKVISEIKANDPDFMDRFGQEMQSGDHLRIQAALEDSGKIIKEEIQKSNVANLKQSSGDRGDGVVLVVDTNQIIVLLTITIALVVVHVVVSLPEDSSTSSRLSREKLIGSVAERLDTTE